MPDIKYSIIIPLYNKEAHIERAIISVLEQVYTNFELLIVDDASTDAGLELVRSFDDERIKIIQRKAPGPGGYKARNAGVAIAANDWISFLDADDEWKLDYLTTINKLHIKFPNASILSSGWLNFYDDSNTVYDKYYNLNVNTGYHTYDVKKFLENSILNQRPMCSSAVTIKKDTFLASGGFPESGVGRGGDLDTWLRIMMTGAVGAWSPTIGSVYYRNSQNMVTKNFVPCMHENHLVKSLNKFLATDINDDIRKLLLKYLKTVRRSTVKDFFDYRLERVCTVLLGEKHTKTLLSFLIKLKRRLLWKSK